jgi:hypothetical protein
MTTEEALRLLLTEVDYTSGACGPTEMVGAVLPREVIDHCYQALRQTRSPAKVMLNAQDFGELVAGRDTFVTTLHGPALQIRLADIGWSTMIAAIEAAMHKLRDDALKTDWEAMGRE